MQHLREMCVTLFFYSDRGLAIGFAWVGKRTLWSHGCKWIRSFLRPKWAPRDIVRALCITHWESCFVTACLIGSQRNRVIFCHRNHWHNPPFVEPLCAVCIMAERIDRNMDITVFGGWHTMELHSERQSCFNYCPYLQSHTIFTQYGLPCCVEKQKKKLCSIKQTAVV